MGTKAEDIEARHTQKEQAYHALLLYLQLLLPDHKIELHTFAMVITGSIQELKWTQSFKELGIREQQHPALLHDTVVTSIKALTEYLDVLRALAPHSFPLEHDSTGTDS
eukprot:952460-Rhodomonas_salina.2